MFEDLAAINQQLILFKAVQFHKTIGLHISMKKRYIEIIKLEKKRLLLPKIKEKKMSLEKGHIEIEKKINSNTKKNFIFGKCEVRTRRHKRKKEKNFYLEAW